MGSNALCTLVTCDNHHCSCGSPALRGTRRWAFNFSLWFADRNRKLVSGWIRQWQHDSCSFPPLNRFLTRSLAATPRISMTQRAVPVWNWHCPVSCNDYTSICTRCDFPRGVQTICSAAISMASWSSGVRFIGHLKECRSYNNNNNSLCIAE